VVVAHAPDGKVATSLAGSPATLAEPAPVEAGPVGQIVRGIRVAIDAVAETDAAIVWPARFTWVDAETVTSMIQAHGMLPGVVLRPVWRGDPGWPILVPVACLSTLADLALDRMPDELLEDLEVAGVPLRTLDLGDPGVVHDRDTPMERLPDYEAPAMPIRTPPEWGAAAADRTDESPLAGPSLAPYPEADDPQG
jgi:CTP:molybdopterin cytidylyltransferase MocA